MTNSQRERMQLFVNVANTHKHRHIIWLIAFDCLNYATLIPR